MACLLSCATLQDPHLHSSHTAAHLRSLLPLCRKLRHLKALTSLLIVHGLIKHRPLAEHLIHHCALLGYPDLSLSAFRGIEKPNLSLQNSVLRSLSDNGLFEDTTVIYQNCRNSGILSDNYTYPFVIKACTALSDVRLGKAIQAVVIRTGFAGNLVTQTALLDFYAKVAQVGDARKVFDEIPVPDSVAWNALISGYSFNGFDSKAVQVFKDMYSLNVKPNASTLASLFPVCSRFVGGNNIGISFHGLAYKLGYNEEESLVPALISMYANCGDILAARDIFCASSRKDVAVWNAVISAYTRNDKPENAVAMFQMMQMDGVKPNVVTFVSLIPSSENLGNICYVEAFLGYAVKFGYDKEPSVVTALISGHAKLGDIDSAEFLFDSLRKRNLLVWNSMVSAYARHGLWAQSLDAFRLMQVDGYAPDAISIVSLVSSCSESNASLLGKSAHGFSIRNGIDLNLVASNAFLAFYCSNNNLDYSFRIFERMAMKNIVSWNTVVSGCVDNEESEKAILMFHRMRQKGVSFDLITLISILPSCHPMLGLAIHSYAVRTSLITDISLANALITMYINCEDFAAVRLLFNDMSHKSVVSWNAILTGYRLHNLSKEVIELFHQMIKEDQKPNFVTLLNMLPMCHTLLQGKTIHAYIIRRMIPLETPLLTSLMIMYGTFNNLTVCLMLLDIGDKTNISLWNTVLSVCLLSKISAMAFSFFNEMLQNEIEPDDVTVLNVISTCVDMNSMYISDSILAYLVRKAFDKYVTISNALIDLYGKCGNISYARTIFDVMSLKDTISWSTIINAYGLYGHIEAVMELYSWMRGFGVKPDKITYINVLSACSHAGAVELGRMVFNSMICEGIRPGFEHYACLIDLLGRSGHLNEAYDITKNFPGKPYVKVLESLLGACLSHGNYMLGEEIGRLILEMNAEDCGPYVILHNIYAAAGKWIEAENVRRAMEQCRLSKAPGICAVDRVVHTHVA